MPARILTRARIVACAAALATVVGVLASCGAPPVERLTTSTPTFTVALTVDPPVVGDTVAIVEVADLTGGAPVENAAVTLVPVMTHMGHISEPVTAGPDGSPGRYRVTGELFFMDGVWDLDVQINSPTGRETARFRVLASNR